MYILSILLIVILVIIALLAIVPLKVSINIDSKKLPNYNFVMSWMNPLLKGRVTEERKEMLLKLYLINNKIYSKSLLNNGALNSRNISNKINFIKSLNPDFQKLEASYGFEDPSITGMLYGAISLFSQNIKAVDFYNNPDFNMLENHFCLNTVFTVSIPHLLISYYRYSKKPNAEILYSNK